MPTIAAISDTHGRHGLLTIPDVDVLIHCGDACGRGTWDELAACITWMGQQTPPDKIFVPGNHDFPSAQATDKFAEFAAANGVRVLVDEGVDAAGLRVWGSPWTPVFGRWAWQRAKGEQMAQKWRAIEDGLDVLVTHGPPHGHGDRTFWGPRAGCKPLLERVREVRPRVHLFGHIHEGHGSGWIDDVEGDDGTRWFNVATVKMGRGGLHEPVVISL